jgi:hypothetical protein
MMGAFFFSISYRSVAKRYMSNAIFHLYIKSLAIQRMHKMNLTYKKNYGKGKNPNNNNPSVGFYSENAFFLFP